MSKILKNNTASPVNVADTGVTVPASGQYLIPATDYPLWTASDDVVVLVGDGTLTVNDGNEDLGIGAGVALIQGHHISHAAVRGRDGTLTDVIDDSGVKRFAVDMKSDAFQDIKVKVSGADTANGYLDSKIISGTHTTKTIINPGADEDLKIDVDPATIDVEDLGNVAAGATDGDVLIYNGTSSAWEPGALEIIADMGAVQARRTTAYNYPTSFTDITLDTTDVENNVAIIEHDNTNTERVKVYETGLYLITYHMGAVVTNAVSLDFDIYGRVLKNGATTLPGSETEMGQHYSGSATYSEDSFLSASFVAELTAGDYITLQARYSGTSTPTAINSNEAITFSVTRLKGRKGDKGDTGAGSTVTLEDDGVNVGNFDTLNFTGATVITDAGGGQANIALATVFGSEYQKAESLARSTTTSATYINKLTLTTSSLPAGDYIVFWSAAWGNLSDNKKTAVQVTEDATTVLSTTSGKHQQYASDGWSLSLAGHAVRTLSGVHTFELDYEAGDGTAFIEYARLTLWRVN